jgi:PKD repeat protein
MRGVRVLGACALACVALFAAACQTPTTGSNTAPTASFTATPPVGVAPLAVAFDASASFDTGGSISAYAWDFGDGGTATGVTANHTFTTDGTYTVTLTVTDNGGLTASTTRVVTAGAVNVPPVAVAGSSTSSGTAPLSVTFSSLGSSDADGSIVGYLWDFGDGSPTTTAAAPTHTFTTPGIYTAVLTVTDDDGAVGSDSVTVAVGANQPPVALASADVTTGKAPLVVAFSSAGSTDLDGTITSYSWNFGDGSPTSAAANPSHTFAAPGSYTATLTVTDNLGATDDHTVAIEATPNLAPVAVAGSDVTAGTAPLIVNFDGTASSDADGTIVSYLWNFGGSNSSSSATPQYTFPVAGSYPVSLTVTDDNGATNTATTTIEVGATPNVPPTAVAGAAPTSGKRNLAVSFTSSGSTDSDGTIQNRSWNFGDGGSSTQANPTHTYTVAGTYTATLTVTDNAGAIDTDTVLITVTPNQPPVAVAGASQTTVKTGVSITFSSAGTNDPDGTVASRSWDFGDGGSSTAANPAHSYAAPGTYTATLTATDDTGDTATSSVVITVNANTPPTAVLNATPQSGAKPLVVNFSSAGSTDGDGTIASYAWDFGNGGTSTAANPTATYATAGTFTATLTVTDDNGATDVESVTITAVVDDDGDGVSPPTDCNDADASIKPGAPDALDASGTDTNCDGIDGVLTDTILVAGTGADTATCGTAEATPCQTLPYGISRAGSSRHAVLVTGGLTSSTVSLGSVSGFTVRGGYGADFTSRSGTTTINNGVTSTGSTGLTLADLTINGPGGPQTTGVLLSGSTASLSTVVVDSGTPTGSGSSAYGVRAVSSSSVTITSSTITAKAGIAGAPGGATAPAAPSAGCNGPDGGNAGGPSSPGGGGTQGCGSGTVKGGNGGTGGNYSGSGSAGGAGGGGAAGGNGGCGSLFGCGTDAGGGAGGGAGSAGGAGSGGTNVLTSAGATFVGINGGAGSGGGVGGGGGGGGGGKSASASGGGGGAGGNGGAGGTAATAAGSYGGGSFGVYAHNSTISLTNTTVTATAGGAGGAGSPGGAGAGGGKGGNGGSDSCCSAGGGGGGGAGAGGGGGGGAGGGAGGPSIAVFHSGTGTYTESSSTLNRAAGAASGGAGGAGGAGGGAGAVGSGNDGSGAGGTAANGATGATGTAGASGVIARSWNNGVIVN